ncbi:hypothetical protein [Novosphingobium soli]|uniref:Transposase n=1 Tax=Novosphingobium soli TaxID=574956 RepID=A0ABV6CWV6_9SPHN
MTEAAPRRGKARVHRHGPDRDARRPQAFIGMETYMHRRMKEQEALVPVAGIEPAA